ncbi:MAG TPA: DUF1127 domain-containing protein [Pseudomonas sp.]|uniref:DUF1127 domain-containing protein n=1 Tax=Pseudomonas sp. TaxID=306 RepID=UPI00260E87DB|nr:DUF1127 domain-containing protein [Pseudomonas sp.]HSX86557.1 DUF1127 domain-containing protein [Pseudomonas sp.]
MKGQKGYAIASAWQPQTLSPRALVGLVWRRLKRWNELAKQRQQLATLGDAALKDLGLSRADILEETERPFWDDPLSK